MRRIALLFILALFVGLAPAMADTWTWSFAGATIQGSGTVDIVANKGVSGGGVATYGATSYNLNFVPGSGTWNGVFLYSDDLTPYLDPQIPPYPTNPGILFADGNTTALNIWYQTDRQSYVGSMWVDGAYVPVTDPLGWGETGTFTLTRVPDGGTTVALLGLGIVGLAGLRRKLSL